MADDEVDDTFRPDAIAAAFGPRHKPAPMACCPADGEPLISTMEFRGAEFYCQVCGRKLGFLAPVPKEATPELSERHGQLQAKYDIDRAARLNETQPLILQNERRSFPRAFGVE